MNDDWSYVKTAQVLAASGHIVYNGWATAMIGWQLFLGALFAKLFGPSFTAIRASTVLVAMATAFLVQRTFVRAGIYPRNATLATLVLVTSPLFLPLAVSFMTDIGGLFCIVLCIYTCLRALQAGSGRAMFGWLAFAALSNTLGGTVRQVAWLGVLVIFPCTVWLLRRRRGVIWTGLALYAVSAAIIFGAMQWFQHQPYSIPQPLLPHEQKRVGFVAIRLLLVYGFCIMTWLLPVLIAFVPLSFSRFRRGRDFLLLAGMLCVAVLSLVLSGSHSFINRLAPYPGNYVSEHGLIDGTVLQGVRPTVLGANLRIACTLIIFLSFCCFLIFLYSSRSLAAKQQTSRSISEKTLLVLLVPFALAYILLLLPLGLMGSFFDRYVLPLFFLGLIFLLRVFQSRVQPGLPAVSYLVTAVFAFFAVAGTHDAFSLYRAQAAAFAELRSAGVPATSADGGFEQNGMTQIETSGTLNDPRIDVPSTFHVKQPLPVSAACHPQMYWLTPAVVPRYALSYDPSACNGQSAFAPVPYHNWLAPHSGAIYIVNVPPVPAK